jgi:hypothetical protein
MFGCLLALLWCQYLCQMRGKITKDQDKIWKLRAKPCNPAFYLLCTFEVCVLVNVKIEHPVVFQVIILYSEQSNTTVCCILLVQHVATEH